MFGRLRNGTGQAQRFIAARLYETQLDQYQGPKSPANLLKTTATVYNYAPASITNPLAGATNVTPKTVTTTFPNGQTSQVATTYDTSAPNGLSYGNVTTRSIYDFGSAAPGPLLSRTNYSYQWNSSSAYLSANLLDRPCLVTTYGSGSSAPVQPGCTAPAVQANQASQTIYRYDEANGSPQGTLGNQTSITHWLATGSSPRTQTVYSTHGVATNKIDANGNSTEITLDSTGMFPSSVQQPTTGSIQHIDHFTCDKNTGRLTSHTDPNGVITKYAYNDPFDRVTLVESGVGAINWLNAVSAQSDTTYKYPSSNETDVEQDLNTTNDAALVSKAIYDGLGRQFKAIARDGSVIETGYDGLGRACVISNSSLAANAPSTLSCTVGQNKAIAATDGYTYFSYDAVGRKTVQTQPDGKTLQWGYTGNVVDYKDEDLSHWQWTLDALGRQTKALENDPGGSGALSLETDYTYDTLDNLLSVNQKGASGNKARYRTFVYDSLSRLTNACNPETISASATCTPTGPAWSAVYAYDASGNVLTRTDARAIVTHYAYDGLNRLTSKTYSNDPANTPTLAYGYDFEYPVQMVQDENNPIGHLNSIQATVGTTNLVTWTSGDYDQRGQLTGYTNCLGSNAQSCPGFGVGANLAYDLNEDLVNLIADAGGAVATGQASGIVNGFDGAGRLRSIDTYVYLDNSNNSLVSTAFAGLTYFPGGQVQTANLAIDPTSKIAAISLTRSFDNRSRITGEVDLNSAKQSVYSYSVGYDGTGNVTAYNDSVAGSWTVKSDALHRLLSSTGTYNGKAGTFQETYDAFGNRDVEYFTYGGTQSQPSPYLNFTAGNNRADTYSYDNAGNLLSDGTNKYLYDAENRICAVEQVASSGSMVGYLYAPNGARMGKGTITKTFSCDFTKNGMLTATGLALTTGYNVLPNGDLLQETDGNFNLKHFNVFWEGKLLGTFTGTTYSQSNWSFALNDWLGTKRQITKGGTNSTSFFSGPFGDYLSQTGSGSDPSDQHFTGKERDNESGLDYFGARYYSSNMGRFTSPDEPFVDQNPADPQSWNLYSYARNNPLSNTDSDGRSVNVCTNDANGNQQCTLLSNDQYAAASQGNGSLNVPTLDQVGTNGSGSITDSNGNSVGSASYVSDGNLDYYANAAGYQQLAGASRVVSAVAGVEMSIMAPWAGAVASCMSGGSKGACAANMALSILPEVGELRAGAQLIKAGRGLAAAEILEKAGGFAQATKDFEALNGAEKTLGNVKVKELSDGSKAVLRNFSGDGRPTLEIQNATGTTKVRYN